MGLDPTTLPQKLKACMEPMTAAKHNTLAGVGQVEISPVGQEAKRRASGPTPAGGGVSYSPQVVIAWFEEHGIYCPDFEYRFHPERKWRFDLAWPEQKVALEVQGGIWGQGRHTRGAALLKEWEKLNTAASMGYRIIYVQPRDLCTAATAELIKKCLAASGG